MTFFIKVSGLWAAFFSFFSGRLCCQSRHLHMAILFLLLILLPLSIGIQAVSLYFTNSFLLFNNADFKNYNRETFRQNQALSTENSDDEHRIAYGELRLRFDTQYKQSSFYVDASRQAHWGTDNFQGRDDGKNSIYFNRLYFVYAYSPAAILSLGRQRYEIGDSHWDYFFSDVIDGFDFSYQAFDFLSASVMTDIVSNSVKTNESGIYGVVDKDEETVEDFRGNTVTSRLGLNLDFSIPEWDSLGVRAFVYHIRYAASTEGAADLSENGRNAYNRADGDELTMGGGRLYGSFFDKKALAFDLTYAYSRGRDLQFEGEHRYDGFATALNLVWKKEFSPTFNSELWTSGGYFQPGFVGMKARSMGGMLLWGYKGYYAAPYAHFYHFRDYAKRQDSIQYIDRTNAKTFGRIKEKLEIDQFSGSLAFLGLWETKSSEYMGSEIELELQYRLDNLKFSNTLAAFMPTDYYKRRSIKNKFLPSGRDTFYGLRFAVEYVLDLDYINATRKLPDKPEDRTQKFLKIERESID